MMPLSPAPASPLSPDWAALLTGLALLAAASWFAARRLRTYLMYLQQEDYDARRFLRWWLERQAFDRWLSTGLVVMLPFAWLQPQAATLMCAVWLFWRARREADPTRHAKKPLVMTRRARQTWLLACLLATVLLGPWAWAFPSAPLAGLVALLLLVQLLPLILVAAQSALGPWRHWYNRRNLNEATARIQQLQPTVVGIGGAFGKTSTKYFLNQILSGHAPTLMPGGSINTPLGLAQVIRERLGPEHQFFLAEMGTYKAGSVAELCRLYPPRACAITAIGPAHYERFKSVEAVAEAEFELVHATMATGGIGVLSVDCIPEQLWRPLLVQYPALKLVSSRKEWLRPGDYLIKLAKPIPAGLQLAIEHRGQLHAFTVPIHGATMAPNLATAFALAVELGVAKEIATAALTQATTAPHRLQVREIGTPDHPITLIDDSYNSNPAGFETALQTLALLAAETPTQKARRKVLVTPGLVELGTLHDAEHARLGKLAAQTADLVLVVAPQRIPTFVQALKDALSCTWHTFPNLQQARDWLQQNGLPGDVVLLANDLPDRYEARWSC